MQNTDWQYEDADGAGAWADAARSRVDRLYAEADAPGCDPDRARLLAKRAHDLLAQLGE